MKYKIILKTTYKYQTRLERCLRTWLIDQDVVAATDKILPKLNLNQLSASNKDTHGVSSEEKTVYMFNHIKNNPKLYDQYDWFIFIDDDAILNTKMLTFLLPFLDTNIIYGCNMRGSYPKNTNLIYPSGGGGYLVSNELIKRLPPMINHYHFHEDVNVGQYMQDNNVLLGNTVIVNGKSLQIHFNGWYPLQYKRITLQKENKLCEDKYLIPLLEASDNHLLYKCLTHHYILSDELMDYIYQLFKLWTLEQLLIGY